ncbi:MAG: FG-GAP repeat domain-containing protein, partial [Planctomycetota bacterium]
VSRGWLAQPDAEATGRGFLLIAERELGRINGKPMLESVILRLHRAWSVFGERAPALRPRVLLRLATALIGLPVGDATPFAPDVPAYRMALRCLLQLIDPAGNVLPQAATWMESWPPAERDEWIELTRQCLIIARRIAGPATSGGWAPWPLDERMGWSLQEHEMQLATFSTPGPGFDPPAVSIVQRVPYSTLFNTAPDATITILNSTVGRRPDGKWSLGARLVVNGANMLAWAPDLGRPGGGSFCQPLDGRWFAKFACGDMDGDGRLDVIVGANLESGWEYAGDVAVMSQQPDGRFAAPVPVRTPDLEQPQARSFVLAVTVADLDRDGRCELVVSRTRFNHYNTVVFRFDARGRYRQTDSLLTGEAVSVAVTGGPETLLVLDGYANSSQRRQYDAMGQPFTLGHHLYRYRNEHLDELPIPWTTVGEWNRLGEGVSITTVRDLGESEAHYINHPVAMLSVLGGSWACNRWMLYRGADLAHPIAAHEWHVGTVWHPVTFEIGQTGAGLARRLRDVDLELVMREGPPARGADESRGSEVVTLATTLLAFGSPQAATSVLRERLAAGSLDPAVELQLLGLQLRSLQASGDIAGVGEFARGLSVRSALVPLLLDAAATILRESGQWEQLITLLEPWFNDRWLPDLDHARIGEQLLPMREAARIFAARGIEVRGTQVTVNGEPAGSLAEHFLTNDISQVRQMPGPGGAAGSANGPWTVRTSGARLFGAGGTALMSDVPTVQADGDGARLVGRELVCSGVPVIVDEGPWRMAFDFEIPGGFWDSWYRFGLLAVSPGGISFGTSWSFHLRGELRDDAIEPQFPGLPLLDALIGRKLRLEAEFVPSIGLHRTTLSDATTGDVLGVHPATVGRNYMAMPSIGTRWRVLGLLGEGNWRSEMIIHSIQLRGAVRLWPMVEPDRSRFASGAEGDAAWQSAHDTWMRGQRELPSSLTLQTMSAAARAHLAGRRQEAATILQGLASRLMQGPQPADPAAQAERAELTNCLLLDAAWELGWRDATAFSSQLLALLQSAGQQGPDALEGFVQLIERWLLLRGQWPPEPGLWEGAGGALMTAILRPTTDNVAPLIADRMNRTPVDYTQCRNLAMAAWLAVRVPAQQAFLQDALAAITAASVDNPYLQPVRLWYVHLTGAAASRGALNDDSRRARLAVLFEFHRRAEALGASRAGDDAWFRERTVMPLVTHQRGVHTTREEAVNGSRAACQRLGVLKAPQ